MIAAAAAENNDDDLAKLNAVYPFLDFLSLFQDDLPTDLTFGNGPVRIFWRAVHGRS
jgi:hypothetical protein